MGFFFAGLDVSTQSTKLVVIDTEKEEIPYVDIVHYDSDLPHYGTRDGVIQGKPKGVSESDPRMWIEAVELLFFRLSHSGIPHQNIRCLSVSGQQHGLVSLDAEGKLTRPLSKLWNDFSTAEECKLLTQKMGGEKAVIDAVGNTQRTGYTASKIFHMLRHEPAAYERASFFLLVHNYINFFLTDGVAVMEPGDASGTALWNPRTRSWSKKAVEALDSGLSAKLPQVKPSEKSIGNIASHLVDKYGFSPECRIDAGSGDNMYGAVGTGNIRPGIVTVSLGTSGTAYTCLEEPYIDEEGEIAAFCDSTGRYLPLLCVSNLANGYNNLLELYELSHEQFDVLVLKTPPGNEGRILIPWYTGERTPDLPMAAPFCFGFGLDDFTQERLARAVLEGHVLNLYEGFQRMPVEPEEIRLTGGLSRSSAWCQTIADIFEADAVPVEGEGAALGAAIHAAWVWMNESGREDSLDELTEKFVKLDEGRRRRPNPSDKNIYRSVKRLFHALNRKIRGKEAEDPFLIHHKLIRGS
ncbi:MAG: hypothetical protein JXB26_09495 [Candidatus Aminicenantes bacterium]|nr:hypothetical protein [Candidatus Aminicenantes bacterium]